ncbi:MAG: GH3 auxin-responsive promoter family protein [Myxococcota bacterium]
MLSTSSASHLRHVPAGSVTGAALWAAAEVRVALWERRARNPEDVQMRTLLSHVQKAAKTEFGAAHGFSSIKSYDDFKARVPVRTYADFEPYLERMRKGATDILWPGLIPYYGQSSGTSHTAAKNKFLPISEEQIRWQQKSGFDVVARYLTLSGDREFTGGYTLGLFPPGTIKREGPVGVASNPGIMLTHLPRTARLTMLPRPPIRDIEDYDKKLTIIAESYLDHDVRALSGTTCWFSILFDRALKAARERGRDVTTVQQIWPNLRGLFGGGVHAGPYRKLIDERVGRPVVLIDNYNATEGGVYAVTDRLGENGMMMVPDRGVFYEFVPRADHGKPNPRRLALHEVEIGEEYSVVVSTCSGLFAYAIGDFVRFTGVFPHRIEFAGRVAGMLSVTQELMTALEIERAVSVASDHEASTVMEFSAGADVGVDGTSKGRYLLFVEFENEPEDLGAFAKAFDRELCAQNRVYREHRANDVAILAPVVIPLVRGGSRRFMETLGQSSLQQKFPRIADDTKRDLLRTFARTPNDANQRST